MESAGDGGQIKKSKSTASHPPKEGLRQKFNGRNYDKISKQIIYANRVTANYHLTTYPPYQGWQIAFNGNDGPLETWEDIPYLQKMPNDQSKHHAMEMA